MRPSEEAVHILKGLKQMSLLHDPAEANDRQLEVIRRIREIAIDRLAPITSPGADLRNFAYAAFFNLEVQKDPKYAPYKHAANVLRACTDSLESGRVEQHHIDWIMTSYPGLDKRWIDKLKQLHAPKNKKNEYLLAAIRELLCKKHFQSAMHLMTSFPNSKKPLMVEGRQIYREDSEDGELKIIVQDLNGTRAPHGQRAFSNYYKMIKKEISKNVNS